MSLVFKKQPKTNVTNSNLFKNLNAELRQEKLYFMAISSEGNASYGSFRCQREIWYYFLGKTKGWSQWEWIQARMETTFLVIDWFPRAES